MDKSQTVQGQASERKWKGIGFRWHMLALLMFGTVINYIDRNTVGALAPIFSEDLNITKQEFSWAIASFQFLYTLFQPIAGYLVDFFGVKMGYCGAALIWGISAALHAQIGGWKSLAIFRGFLGASEAAIMPSNVKVMTEWFPRKERSYAAGLFNMGSGIGAMIATPLAIWLAMTWGWRVAFLLTGSLGVLLAIIWYFCYRDINDKNGASEAEREFILADQPVESGEKVPVKKLLGRRQLWGISMARFLSEPAWQTFSYWIPLYLATVKHMDIKSIALFGWLPFLGADLGCLVSGFISPFLLKHCKISVVNSRIASIAVGSVCMVGPALVGFVVEPITAIFLFTLGGFAHQVLSSSLYTLVSDTFEKSAVASTTGFAGMCGYLGGTIFTLVVGALADAIGFEPLFFCLFLFDIMAVLVVWALVGEWGNRKSQLDDGSAVK